MTLAVRVLIGLLAGLTCGAVLAGQATLAPLVVGVLTPLGTIFVNLIRMTVIPLVMSLLVATLGASAAARGLGRTGGRALLIAVGLLLAAAIVSGFVADRVMRNIAVDHMPVPTQTASAPAAASTGAPSLSGWLVDLVPQNVVKSAADGAMLPLIVFSVLFGLALAEVDAPKRDAVLRLVEGIADTMQRLVSKVLMLAPVGVFALAVPLASKLGWNSAGAVVAYVGLVVVLTIVAAVVMLYPLGILAGPMSASAFLAYCAPAQSIAFASRSSLAALPAMVQSAERVPLSPQATTVVLPLAAAVYHFGAAVAQMVGVIFLAHFYGVTLTPLQHVSVVFAVVLATFAVPGIPGGSIIAMVPALAVANLPLDGIGILLAVDAIPDMFRTTANVTGSLVLAAVLPESRA